MNRDMFAECMTKSIQGVDMLRQDLLEACMHSSAVEGIVLFEIIASVVSTRNKLQSLIDCCEIDKTLLKNGG